MSKGRAAWQLLRAVEAPSPGVMLWTVAVLGGVDGCILMFRKVDRRQRAKASEPQLLSSMCSKCHPSPRRALVLRLDVQSF